jgi:hypothetical protein
VEVMFAVEWHQYAIQKLLQIEQEAENPESIRQAAAYMDFNLRRMPHDMGESRDMDYRAWYSDVLGLYFRVIDATNKVIVVNVAKANRK